MKKRRSRNITFAQAMSDAIVQAMAGDRRIFLYGIGVDDPKGIFGTTTEAFKRFGPKRVFDTPVSENALTGFAIGAALTGLRPVLVHARNDFVYYSMDQLANHAGKWKTMFGGRLRVPIVIRAIIGRGWGQGPQHSQSLQALFAHIPGLKVVMPSTPFDAKGLFLACMKETSPVIFLEHRHLHRMTGAVPAQPYTLPVGKGVVVRAGRDVTVVALSAMVPEAVQASQALAREGIQVEIVDPRWIKPFDEEILLRSIRKTGRLVIADTAWRTCGVSAEIAALASEKAWDSLRAPIVRVTLPDLPAPSSPVLEQAFYPGAAEIAAAARKLIGKDTKPRFSKGLSPRTGRTFTGPF